MQTQKITYHDGNTPCEGYVAAPDDKKRPVVLVVHDWSGRNEFAEKNAQMMCEWGYIGFAVDMFGEGKTGTTKDEKRALIQPLVSNRKVLRQRLEAAINAAKKLPHADTHKIAIIGFCFGGLCALEIARSGNSIQAAVCIHGLLNKDPQLPSHPISAKIFVLHGYDDPMVPHEQIIDFSNEMTECKADWQLQVFGNTMHAFTNPSANDKDFGTVYNPVSAKRAFSATKQFLSETFE